MRKVHESKLPLDKTEDTPVLSWEMTYPASIETVAVITEAIDELLDSVKCSFKARTQVDVALDEILSNVAKFAYAPGEGPVTVSASVTRNPPSITITIADEGEPFNPLMAPEPDTTLPLEKRKVGGLGIMLVRKMMDEVSYARKGRHNLLTFRKEL